MTTSSCGKSTLSPEMLAHLRPSTENSLPKVRQLYLNLYSAIESGELPYEFKLPSSRELAHLLSLGRNTVITVYEQLCSENLLHSDGRRGTHVCRQLPEQATKTTGKWPRSLRSTWLQPASKRHLALAPGAPDTNLFPAKAWRRAQTRAAALPGKSLGYRHGPLPELQQALARYLVTYRSLQVDPQQILITASTRQSLLVAATLFADIGDEAWVESPGYRGAYDAFTQQGMKVTACQVDAEGFVLPERKLEGSCVKSNPRIVYLTPCFQYPLGMPLSAERRDALIRLSCEQGAILFEDDYDSEFRNHMQPHPALASQCEGARVLHAGTFSKLLFPAVRVAWLIVPHAHVSDAQTCLQALGGGNNTVAQAAVLDLLLQGDIQHHLHRARHIYGQRRRALIKALNSCDNLIPNELVGGGLNLVLQLEQPVPIKTLETSLSEAELGAVPLERMKLLTNAARTCSSIVIGLGNVETLAIDNVITKLDKAIVRNH